MADANKERQVLFDIVKYCEKMAYNISRFGNGFLDFIDKKNYRIRDVSCFYLFQIGELTTHLSDEFKTKNDNVLWRELKGLRNIVAHRYGSINFQVIWHILQEDMPKINESCREILQSYDSQYETKLQKELKEETDIDIIKENAKARESKQVTNEELEAGMSL